MSIKVEVYAKVAGRTYHLGFAEMDTLDDPALSQLLRALSVEVRHVAKEVAKEVGTDGERA